MKTTTSALLAGSLCLAAAAPAQAQGPAPAAVAAPAPTQPAAAPASPPAAYPPGAYPPAAYPPAAYPPPAYPPGYYPPAPPPPGAVAPNGQYVAPLSQTTQPTYVPQSVALSGPRMIRDWREGDPIPPGYHREDRVRKGAIISGSIIFGVPYLYSGLIAAAGNDVGESDKTAALFVPVLGPFIEMGQTDSATVRYLLAIDGGLQAVGAFLMIYGLAVPKAVLVRNDLAFTVTPMHMGRDGTGLGLVGVF